MYRLNWQDPNLIQENSYVSYSSVRVGNERLGRYVRIVRLLCRQRVLRMLQMREVT